MKSIKLALVLATVALLSIASVSVASAGKGGVDNQKANLYPVEQKSSDYPVTTATAQGKVMVNNPMGANEMIVQGSVMGLKPNTNYQVWARDLRPSNLTTDGPWLFVYSPLGYAKLMTFDTDALGNGGFNYHMPVGTLVDTTYRLQVAINEGGAEDTVIGWTVLATPLPGAGELTLVISSK